MRVCSWHGSDSSTVVAAAVLIVLVLSGLQCDATVSGAKCPFDLSAAESWCQDMFGRGGNLTVGQWDPSYFECVCNGRTTVSVTVTSTTVVGPGYYCTWKDTFEPFPGGEFCYPTTDVCPTRCSDISPNICDTTITQCTDAGDIFNYSCTTCEGQLFTIDGTASGCQRHITRDELKCTPDRTCNGHGCCARPPHTDTPPAHYPTCTCFRDSMRGFWTGTNCDHCAEGYEPGGSPACTNPTPKIQVILSSIAKSWTMVLPNMAVLFLFVVLGLARRLWDSDTDFELTRLRRANLSHIQIARRGEQSLFHSKYIPARPANSRSFANTLQQHKRGPPAY